MSTQGAPNLGIFLSAQLDQTSVARINKDLQAMQSKVKPVNLNTKQFSEYNRAIQGSTKHVQAHGNQFNKMAGQGMGAIEQFRIAMTRIPKFIGAI